MSVGEDYPKEQARLVALLETYREIGPAGAIGYQVVRRALMASFEAMASGDVLRQLRAYEEMRECS